METTPLGQSPPLTCSAFLIKMRDGSRYAIPLEFMIQHEIKDTMGMREELREEMEEDGTWPLTEEMARKWAVSKFDPELMKREVEVEDVFRDFVEWSQLEAVAIRLPDEKESPHDMWDDSAKISYLPNAIGEAPAINATPPHDQTL